MILVRTFAIISVLQGDDDDDIVDDVSAPAQVKTQADDEPYPVGESVLYCCLQLL